MIAFLKKHQSLLLLIPLLGVTSRSNAQLSFTQKRQIDSLQQVVKTAKHDTIKVQALLDWDNLIYSSDPDLDFDLNKRVEKICDRNLKKSLSEKEQSFYENALSDACNNLGIIYFDKGSYAPAIDYYTKSLKMKERLKDTIGIALTENNIGLVYFDQNEFKLARKHYQNSLRILRKFNEQQRMASLLNNLGLVFFKLKEYSKAFNSHMESLEIRESIKDSSGIASSYLNLGLLHRDLQEYDQAIDYFEKSLSMKEKTRDNVGISAAYINLGVTYDTLGNLDKAITHLKLGLEYGQKAKALIRIKEASKQLYECYMKLGRGQEAFENYRLYIASKDSLESDDVQKAILRTEFEYDYKKQKALDDAVHEKEIAVQKEAKKKRDIQIYFSLGALIFSFIFIGFIINRYRATRRQKKVIEVEQQRSEELLLNILPSETAQELKSKGYADPKNYELVSVLFTDFKGFTQIAEKLSPNELVKEINHCFKRFDEIITSHGIEKIKTIGDAYMAAGGLPVVKSENAVDVVNAALDIRDFMKTYRDERLEKGLPAFEIRIGVHSGPVVAGIVGIKKFAYDIWGDTVNTASRMESSGEPGKVNVSGTTYGLISEHFASEFRGKIPAKNKEDIEMYFIERK